METFLRRLLIGVVFFLSVISVQAQTAQTISFPTISGQRYGTPLTLSATASSGLLVSFSITSGLATISGNVVTFTGTGWVTVQASQAGNATYSAKTVSQTFSVDKGLQTISFDNPGPQVLGATVTLTATASSGLTPGLAITAGSGTLSGHQLTITNTSPVTVTATQGGNQYWYGATSISQTVTVTTGSVPAITSLATASGNVGTAFSYQITGSNSPTSYTATALPGGLTFSTSTGLISGTPTATGTTSVTLTASNANGTSPGFTLTITINPALPVVTSDTITGQLNSFFSYQIVATNSPTSYSASNLPTGLTYNATSGVISGTPTVSATTAVILTATNTGGAGSGTLTLTIANNLAGLTAQDIGNVSYTGSTIYNSGSGAYVVTGSGADIWNTADGFQFGWKQMSGDFSIVARIDSVSGSDSWSKAGIMIRDTLQAGSTNAMVLISKNNGATFQRRLSTGASSVYNSGPSVTAPYWIKIQKAGTAITAYTSASGTTWTQFSNDTLTFGATMYVGLAVTSHGTGTATGVFSNVSFVSSGSPPVISSLATTSGTVGLAFSSQITASNSPTSYVATGLPAGLSCSSAGLITGTPTTAGSYSVSFTATNAYGTSPAFPQTITILAAGPTPVITSDTTITGQLNGNFSYQILASNSPTSYNATSLPTGLSINISTGLISGTATASGTFSVGLTASNAAGPGTATLNLTITSAPGGLTAQDIGPVVFTGSTLYNPSTGTYTATGSGTDIWSTADSFHFDAKQVTGDFWMVVKVNSLTGADAWAKAGLMMRDTPQPGAINALALVSTGSGIAFQRRLTTNGTSNSDVGSALHAPIWLKLQRVGTLITAYNSSDGTAWTQFGSATVNFGTTVYAGLAVTSHGNGTATAIFSNLSYTAGTASTALPYTTDFESSQGFSAGVLPQQGWALVQGSASVSSADHSLGTQSVLLASGSTPAVVRQTFASATGETVEFVDFFAKPIAQVSTSAAPTFVVGTAKFGFQINGSVGTLQALNGSGWSPTTYSAALNPNHQTQAWIRLTARLDYTTQKWDLYANGQMVAGDLAFATAGTYLDQFQMTGDMTTSSGLDDFYAGPANPLFASGDVNNNGIDDAWETAHGLSLSNNNRELSPTGNGVTVVQAYVNGTDPNDFYNGATPQLTIISGNYQVGMPSSFNLAPFDVAVSNASGTLLTNAPVTFTMQSGGGSLALTSSGNPALNSSIKASTGSDGTAQGYYKQPAAGIQSQILVTAGSAQVYFTTSSFLDQNQAGLADLTDSDHDGIPDAWEMMYFGNLNSSGTNDPDGDGATNIAEYMAGTNPNVNEKTGSLGTGFQVYLRLPNGSFRGVKSDWSIVPVP